MRTERRTGGRERWRSSLPTRALHTYAEASIYNVPLARVVSKKSITQQHTRESCTRYLRMVHPTLARSPLLSHYGGSAEHSRPLQASIFSGVPSRPPPPPCRCVSHIYFILPAHLIRRPFLGSRDGILYQAALPMVDFSGHRFDRTRTRLKGGDVERRHLLRNPCSQGFDFMFSSHAIHSSLICKDWELLVEVESIGRSRVYF